MVVLRIMDSLDFDTEDENQLFPLLLMQSIFWPLQGFWNLMCFVRPSYLVTRREFPNETRWWAFWRALHGAKVHPTDDMESDRAARAIKAEKEGKSGLVSDKIRRREEAPAQSSCCDNESNDTPNNIRRREEVPGQSSCYDDDDAVAEAVNKLDTMYNQTTAADSNAGSCKNSISPRAKATTAALVCELKRSKEKHTKKHTHTVPDT